MIGLLLRLELNHGEGVWVLNIRVFYLSHLGLDLHDSWGP